LLWPARPASLTAVRQRHRALHAANNLQLVAAAPGNVSAPGHGLAVRRGGPVAGQDTQAAGLIDVAPRFCYQPGRWERAKLAG
jgi:hypothetical protein